MDDLLIHVRDSRDNRNLCGADPTDRDCDDLATFRQIVAGLHNDFLAEHGFLPCRSCTERLPPPDESRGRRTRTKQSQRTDPHRKGAIVPGDYTYVLSYWTGNSQDPDGYGLDELLDLRESGAKFFSDPDTTGRCDACGARFGAGDVWKHKPTGEHIHLGHDCAYKYGLMVDRSAFELGLERHKAAMAVEIQRRRNEEARQAFLDEHPGLAVDLEVRHRIVEDIKERFTRYHSLSPAQIALVHKIANEIRNPKPREQEAPKADAPSGRVSITGQVVATKVVESQFGDAIKMLVVIRTSDGSEWKAWGTVPASLLGGEGPLKGHRVAFTATFAPKEKGFAFFSRPSSAKLLD